MARELKARINDYQTVEQKLVAMGAKFTKEETAVYTYFKQPPGKVLKLTETDGQTYKTVIEARGDQFEVVSNDLVDSPRELSAKLSEQYGIKRNLTNQRRYYDYQGQVITTNQIKGVGQFLIIESEKPSPELLAQLGIDESAIITDSFDNL